MANSSVLMPGSDSKPKSIIAVDSGTSDGQGHELYRLAVDSAVTIDPGTITIGAVKMQDATSATEAVVALPTTISEGSNAIAVQAPVLGKIADAVDKVGNATTINAKLRGLIQLFAAGIPAALGQTTMAASLPVVVASNQSAIPVSLSSDIEIGAVKLLDSAGTNEGQIAAASAIAEAGSTKLAVHDPTIGLTTGAAVITDANGTLQQYLRGLVKLTATDDSQVVTPTNQASTNALVDFAGSELDTLHNSHCSYTLLNTDLANGLTWQILAANRADFSDAFINNAPASIAAGQVGHVGIAPANNRYYKVQIVDTVSGNHATGQLTGVGKV